MTSGAAPAKINLALVVGPRRPDGLHEVATLLQRIDLADTVSVEPAAELAVEGFAGDTLVHDALVAVAAAAGVEPRWRARIEKQIPVAAGLGGGSSDAASTLLALNRLWGLDWPLARLLPIGLALGADLPFFLHGRPARVGGIGEQLAPVALAPAWFAVVKPAAGLETARVFGSRQVAEVVEAARIAGFPKAEWRSSDEHSKPRETEPELDDGFGRNDLQAAAEALCPEVSRAVAGLQAVFGNGRMTGSGSAVFARAGDGPAPSAAMPSDWPEGWSSRMCRSLERHPLASWARRDA
jgi:4-diphosphocytidyl-2-C-methyl-D-erythritol kinase